MILATRKILLCSLLLLLLTACKAGSNSVIDDGVIVAEKAEIRNSTALVAAPLKELKRGDQVAILARQTVNQREFVRVRTDDDKPVEGWLEARVIISKKIVNECDKLAEESKDVSVQAIARTKDKLKLRLKPGRDTEVVTLLPASTKLEIIGRSRVERHSSNEGESETASAGETKYDNWLKVRLEDNPVIKAGWLYAESVELLPPDAIAGLPGAGRKFVAWQGFGDVTDSESGEKKKHYIILDKYAYSKDDEIDFDRIYIVVWDNNTHGYSSIFIESQLRGLYPLKFEDRNIDYVFTVPLFDKQKAVVPTKYLIRKDAKSDKLSVTKYMEPKPPKAKSPKKPAK